MSSRPPGPRRPGEGRRGSGVSSQGGPAAPKPSAQRTTRFTARAAILVAVGLLLIVSYATSVHAWWKQRGEITALQAQNRAAAQEIEELEDLKERWKDPAYVTQQARERFGWVMPGEVGYKVIGIDGQIKGETSALDEPAKTSDRGWSTKLWGSIEVAGNPPEPETPAKHDDVIVDSGGEAPKQ